MAQTIAQRKRKSRASQKERLGKVAFNKKNNITNRTSLSRLKEQMGEDAYNKMKNLAQQMYRYANQNMKGIQTSVYESEYCTDCKNQQTDERVLQVAKKSKISEMYAYMGICPSCRNNFIGSMKVLNSSKSLILVMKDIYTLPPLQYQVKTIDLKKLCNERGLYELLKIPQSSFNRFYKVRVAKCQPSVYHKQISEAAKGAYFQGNMDHLAILNKHRVLSNSDNNDATILIIGDKDYVLLSKLVVDPKSICEFSKSMMKHVDSTGKRAGAASGYYLTGDDCTSRSHVAQHETALVVATPKSTSAKLVYNNKNNYLSRNDGTTNVAGDIKSFLVYRDIHGLVRLKKNKKVNLIKKNVAYRKILIKEGFERIKTILVLLELGVIDTEIVDDMIEKLMDVSHNSMYRDALELKHSVHEAIILSYMTHTGEMINFSALAAHKDGNTSHPVETLTYTGRVSTVLDKERTDEDIVDLMEKAQLLLCEVGVIVECDVPHDIMHCSLKNTTHAADQNRNYTNFSRVYGP